MNRILRRLRRPRPRLDPDDRNDLIFVGGLALVTFGVALIYFPAGVIAGGVVLAAIGWQLQRAAAADAEPARQVERWYSDGGSATPSDEDDA